MTRASDLRKSWERPVWYQLVDVQGNKLGSVGRVKVSSDDALIVDFLDEVEKKNERGRLKEVGVIDLAVYDSSDAANPMKASDTIGSRGKTDSTALIVEVPSLSQLFPQPLQSRREQLTVGGDVFYVGEGMTVNPPKLTAFWTALAQISTEIELPRGIYILGDQRCGARVFGRDCYKRLLDVCKDKIHGRYPHLVMLGSPGVGKTFFGFVLLLEFARTGKTVVYQHGEDERILLSPDVAVRGSGGDFKQFLREPDTYYIVDGVRPASYNCMTILLASPNREVWSQFYKKNCTKVYVPVWSEEEIFKCRALMYSEVPVHVVMDRFYRWGGIPRYVLGFARDEDQQMELKCALERVNLESLCNAFGKTAAAASEISHRLLHYHVSGECFGKAHLVFASLYVQGEVFQRLNNLERNRLLNFIKTGDGNDGCGVLRGQLLEGSRALGAGKKRKLLDSTASSPQE